MSACLETHFEDEDAGLSQEQNQCQYCIVGQFVFCHCSWMPDSLSISAQILVNIPEEPGVNGNILCSDTQVKVKFSENMEDQNASQKASDCPKGRATQTT